jgi:hypothetical protein
MESYSGQVHGEHNVQMHGSVQCVGARMFTVFRSWKFTVHWCIEDCSVLVHESAQCVGAWTLTASRCMEVYSVSVNGNV